MTVDDLIGGPHRLSRSPLRRGRIVKAPLNDNSPMFVVAVNYSVNADYEVPASQWQSTPGQIPVVNGGCFIQLDEEGDAWVPIWEGVAVSLVQDEGSPLTKRTHLNFVGAGVTATDDAAGDRSVITIPGGGGGSDPSAGSVIYAKSYLDAVPGTYANNTLAIEAAMAATSIYGGKVILPTGLITQAAQLDFPAKDVDLEGASRGGTILQWATDLGAGVYAIKRTNGKRQVVRHLSVLGPVNAVVDGANANMWGIQQLGRNGIEDVHAQGFKAGIVRAGDHSWMRGVSSKANRDGIYHMGDVEAGVSTGGNNQLLAPMELDNNSRAGIAFAPLAYTFGEKWEGIHFGLCPTPVHWEVNGSNNAASVEDMTLDTCVFENVGNSDFYSASTTQAGVFQAVLLNCTGAQNVGANNAAPAGFRSTALRTYRAHLDGLASVDLACINTDMFGFAAGPIPLALQHCGYQSISMEDSQGLVLSSAIANGARLFANPLAYQLVAIQFRERQYNREAELHYCSGLAVTAGRLVYRFGDGAIRPWVANKEVYGVAMQGGASLDFIPIGRKGIWPVANSATVALAAGDPVVPDLVTADGKITKAAVGTGAIIGTAVEAIAVSATGRVDFTPTGWRF